MFNEETRRKDLRADNSQALSQRTRGKVRTESGRENPKIDHSPSLKESSTATIAAKKGTSKAIVRLERIDTRRIGEVKKRLIIRIPQPL